MNQPILQGKAQATTWPWSSQGESSQSWGWPLTPSRTSCRGVLRTVLGIPEKHGQEGAEWGGVTSVPRWSGWGGCWRSSIEKGEERVVLCQCSPEESGNSPENEYFPSLSPFHQNCRPPTKSAALLPKSVELLYIIRVPRILLYCLLRKLGFKSYLVDRCTQMQELFLLQIWGYFKWHASNSL